MSHDVDVNRIDEKQKREAEKLANKYMDKGMGHDQAKNQALEDVANQHRSHQTDQSDHEPQFVQGDHSQRTSPSGQSTTGSAPGQA